MHPQLNPVQFGKAFADSPDGSPAPNLVDITGISVRRAQTQSEVEQVFDVRWAGYKKYFSTRAEIVDFFDEASNAVLLLAVDVDGRPLGTIRLLDRRHGAIELDQLVAVDSLLTPQQYPVVEATRFSMPHGSQSRSVTKA